MTPARPGEPSRSLRTAAGTGRGNTWRRGEAPPQGTAGSVPVIPPEQDRTPQCHHPRPPPHRCAGAATAERRRRGPFSSCAGRAAARFHCPGLPARAAHCLTLSLPAPPDSRCRRCPPAQRPRSPAPAARTPLRRATAAPAPHGERSRGRGLPRAAGGAGPRRDYKDQSAPPANVSFAFWYMEYLGFCSSVVWRCSLAGWGCPPRVAALPRREGRCGRASFKSVNSWKQESSRPLLSAGS